MGNNKTSIRVRIAQDYKDIRLQRARLVKMIQKICRRFGLRKAMVSVAVVADDQMRKINVKFSNRANSTDVISFDLSDDTEPEKVFELVINAQRARREAHLRHRDTQSELALYIVHGLLHNLGFNDAATQQAEKMHAMEDNILQEFGYGTVYKG